MKKCLFYKKELYKSINKIGEYDSLVKKVLKVKLNTKQVFAINIKKRIFKKTFCLKTGHKRSINSLYYLSRMSLKEEYRKGLLLGLKKIQW